MKRPSLRNRVVVMMAAMAAAPRTINELTDLSGLCRATVYSWVKMLYACQVVHVGEWRNVIHRTGPHSKYSGMYRAYALGRCVDTPRPTKLVDTKIVEETK